MKNKINWGKKERKNESEIELVGKKEGGGERRREMICIKNEFELILNRFSLIYISFQMPDKVPEKSIKTWEKKTRLVKACIGALLIPPN